MAMNESTPVISVPASDRLCRRIVASLLLKPYELNAFGLSYMSLHFKFSMDAAFAAR